MRQPAQCEPTETCTALEEGDVVFYLPSGENLDALAGAVGEGRFADLAGYVEAFPYVEADDCFLPLVHVEVFVGDDAFVGFRGQDTYADSAPTRLEEAAAGLGDFGSRYWVARFNNSDTATCVSSSSVDLANGGVTYAHDSLLAFAQSTSARMKPQPARATAMLRAFGLSQLAVEVQSGDKHDQPHMSCVTAVLSVLKECGQYLDIVEAPVVGPDAMIDPAVDDVLGAFVPSMARLQPAFTDAAQRRVEASIVQRVETILANFDTPPVDIVELDRRLLEIGQLQNAVVAIWGPGLSGANWDAALSQAAEALLEHDPDADLIGKGLGASDEARDLLVSPAMLWRSLQNHGEMSFFELGVEATS